jgi:hypothetical protein
MGDALARLLLAWTPSEEPVVDGDFEPGRDEPEIVTRPWPKHHAMPAQSDRLEMAVDGDDPSDNGERPAFPVWERPISAGTLNGVERGPRAGVHRGG